MVRGMGWCWRAWVDVWVKSNRAGTEELQWWRTRKILKGCSLAFTWWGIVKCHLLRFNWIWAHCSELCSYCHLVPLSVMALEALSSKDNWNVKCSSCTRVQGHFWTRRSSGWGHCWNPDRITSEYFLWPWFRISADGHLPLIGTKSHF